MYYLEEAPLQDEAQSDNPNEDEPRPDDDYNPDDPDSDGEPRPDDDHDPDDPDCDAEPRPDDDHDPDDPDWDGEPGPSSDEDNEDNEGNFNFGHDSLNAHLQFERNRTVREEILIQLALAIRHRNSYEQLIDTFRSKNVLYGKKTVPNFKEGVMAHFGKKQCWHNFPHLLLKVSVLHWEKEKSATTILL